MKTNLITAYILLGLGLACTSQSGGDINSSLDGASINELKTQRAGAAPLYNELTPTLEGNEKVFRIGFFFSYDKDPFVAPGRPVQFNDLSFQSYKAMREYFNRFTDQGGVFLRQGGGPKIVMEEPNRYVVLRGQGTSIGQGKEALTWEVTLAVGGIQEVTQGFGKAMANHHVTVLNGHFYSSQLPGAPANQGVPTFDMDTLKQRVYLPAMQAFAAEKAVKNANLPYRIVVFNGCGSETVENLVLERYGPGKVDIVGQRGVSNYRYFHVQLVKFVNALVNGKVWTDTLETLTFMAPPDQSTQFLPPSARQVTPVLRSRY